MMNNDVLLSVRYMLNLNNEKMISILALADTKVTLEEMASFLTKEGEE